MPPFTIFPEKRLATCAIENSDFYQNPYEFYQTLHGQMPVFYWEEFGFWCFSQWDDVNKLVRDRRFGREILHVATRDELGWAQPSEHTKDFDRVEARSLLSLEPPGHTRLRALVNRAFVSRQVEQLRPKIEAYAHKLIDGFENDGSVELISQFATPIPVMIISEMLGVPNEMSDQLLDWSHKMVKMYTLGHTKEVEREADNAAREFASYISQLAIEKEKCLGEDLISHMLVTEHKGQKLTPDELVSTAVLLLNAGHEATVHQAGNAVKAILESSQNPKDLFLDDQTTEKTVEECLRFDAPLHMFMRYALEDIQLENGVTLKKGEEIGLMFGAANRDPLKFENPGRFDIHRSDQKNITFGAGIHFCIGAPLARIELQVALRVLFERLPNIQISKPPQYRNNFHFHGLERLDLHWD